MEFGVLGPLEIRREGEAVELSTRKQRALLILLLLDIGRAVSVDRLVDDLWSGAPPPAAVVTLRSYVSNLRRALEGPQRLEPVVLTRGQGYVLDAPPESVDAIRFEQLAAQGRKDLDRGRAGEALDGLDAALGLWRGQALADVAYEDFAQGPAERLEELRRSAEEDRFEALLALGRERQAVAELRGFTAAHPLRERSRGQLMLALYRAGRAPDALQAYHEFRAALADQLGLDPSPALVEHADRILKQSPELDLHGPAVRATAAEGRADAVEPGPAPGTNLVGRERERARLEAALARLDGGSGGLVLVAGEPGIGKTALLLGLERAAGARGLPVHWGRCQEAEGMPPFWPWVQIVRAIADRMDDAELARATAGAAAPVTQMVDAIAARLGGGSPVSGDDPHALRFALYEAVVTFLRRAAAPDGMALVLDDLHWADTPSLQLLAFLSGQLDGRRMLVAGSYRDLPAERSPDLDAALATIARAPGADELRLGGLAREHVAAVVGDVTGVDPPEDLVAAVHDRTAGNPFFVHQLARLLDEASGARGDGRVASTVPVAVRHVINRRLQLAPEASRTLLDAAAVAGREFDLKVVAAAAGMPLGDALDALDGAVAHGLAEELAGPAVRHRFVHALIRETVYEGLTPARAARLHAAIGEALERLPGVGAGELAEHFWRAADLVDDDRPVRHMVAAADEALRVLAYEQGEDYLRRALHLLAHRPGGDPAGELVIRLRLMQLLISAEGWSAVSIQEVAGRARQLADLTGVGQDLVPMWWSLWTNCVTRGEYEIARDLTDKLLHDAPSHPDPAGSVAAHVMAGYTGFFNGGDASEQLAHMAQARALAGAADEALLAATPEHVTVSMHVAEATVRALGAANGAVQVAQQGVARAEALGRPFAEAYARLFAGWVGAVTGEPEFARDVTEAGLRICAEFKFRHAANLTIPANAWARAQLGEDPAEQASRIEAALDGLSAAGQRHAHAQWLVLLADTQRLAGAFEEAERRLSEAEATSIEVGEPVYGPQIERLRQRLDAERR